MLKYEIKKVFSKRGSWTALLLLALLLGVTCYFAMDVYYVNENGDKEKGAAAIAKLKAAEKEWAGYLEEGKLRQVIRENRRIRETPEALSDNVTDNNIAYGWGQGIGEIRDLLNHAYAEGFREYDYYLADSLSEADAGSFYEKRTALLTEWLEGEAAEQFSDREKEYLISRYRSIQTPFYYDYMKGFTQFFEFAETIVMITMLILGYLVAGIFSSEFTLKSDAIFFTSAYGRSRAVAAKIKAGFWIVTVIYGVIMLLYTAALLFYFGADGWQCPVQINFGDWKCFYNITVLQKYVLVIIGGYIGCLFLSFLSMFVSAKTNSAVLAVILPFVLIFLPSFLSNINSPAINRILGLLPDMLLQTGSALNYFNLYSFGERVIGALPILFTVYAVLTIALVPAIYLEYRNKQP